jgi:hypothetical protein
LEHTTDLEEKYTSSYPDASAFLKIRLEKRLTVPMICSEEENLMP